VRGIDGTGKVEGGYALVGLRSGTILKVNLDTGAKQTITESHSDGEVWGLARAGDGFYITTCDDNKIKTWSIKDRKCVTTGTISNESRKA